MTEEERTAAESLKRVCIKRNWGLLVAKLRREGWSHDEAVRRASLIMDEPA